MKVYLYEKGQNDFLAIEAEDFSEATKIATRYIFSDGVKMSTPRDFYITQRRYYRGEYENFRYLLFYAPEFLAYRTDKKELAKFLEDAKRLGYRVIPKPDIKLVIIKEGFIRSYTLNPSLE